MSYDKDSAERYDMSKTDEETLTGVDEESEEIYRIKKQDDLESDKSETDERYQIKIPELLKSIDIQKKEMMII